MAWRVLLWELQLEPRRREQKLGQRLELVQEKETQVLLKQPSPALLLSLISK